MLETRCIHHPERPARENLDGDDLCQECCDDWARGEGDYVADLEAEDAFNEIAFEAMNRKLP